MLLLTSAMGPLAAQQPVGPVSYTIEVPETVKVGSVFTVSAVFDIRADWYVYAPIPMNTARGKITTRIRFEPHGQIKAVGGLELPDESRGYDTYSGKDVRMVQKFRVPGDMEPGEQTIRATVRYQTCSNHTCYPPVEDDMAMTIKIERNIQ